MTASVQIVLCMDTEGPCVDPARPDLLSSWELVDRAMGRLFDPAFRRRHPDPSGGHLRIGWFFLTWTGFTTNPRGRVFGYHAVRDHYLERWGDRIEETGDEQCWHYHHPAPSGVGNEWGTDWRTCPEYDAIVSRQVLERGWFPACYRAGGTIMDPVSSRWVDAWFPVDYSNRAPVKIDGLVDWSSGVRDWSVYHPSPEDFRRPGSGRRRMARCLDLHTWIHALTDEEIAIAFERAAGGAPAIVSSFDHDYRDIADRVDDLRARVHRIAASFPHVPWQYAAPFQAVRRYVDAAPPEPLALEAVVDGGVVHVRADAPLYQSIPWLAVRAADGSILHVEAGLERIDPYRWRWTPPAGLDWVEAGFGGSTDVGSSAVVRVCRAETSRAQTRPGRVVEDRSHPRSIWHHSTLFPELCERRASGQLPETDSVAQAIELLAPVLKPGMRVLDAGCAAGHAARSLAPLGVEYSGVDSCDRAIEIGRRHAPSASLRTLRLEDLPRGERYDAVICLNALSYFPMFHEPLDVLAHAADRWLVIRSSFGDRTEIRYLPDVLLEPGFQDLRAYFNIFSRGEIAAFLEAEGFRVRWIPDRRQAERFGGRPEVVGGIALPAEFLFAERERPRLSGDERLGGHFAPIARAWRERREGGPTG